MKKEIAKKWVEALRSGKYKQGKLVLCQTEDEVDEYCCLGVLCEILETPYVRIDNCRLKFYLNNEGCGCTMTKILPESVMKKCEMKNQYGALNNSSLANLNDRGRSFNEIANIIEEKWKEL